MRWETEQWRKLYLREPLEQLLWPVLTRSLRDYLIRRADDTGRFFASTTDPAGDLCQALGAHEHERDIVRKAVLVMLADGFLVHGTDGALYVRNLRAAQERRSKEATRKARQRAKKKDPDRKSEPSDPYRGTDRDMRPGTVPGQIRGSDPIRSDPIRSEKREARERDTAPAPAHPDGSPAAAILAELSAHPCTLEIATDEYVDGLTKQFATLEIAKGIQLAWYLASIGAAALDLAGQPGSTAREKARMVRSYAYRTRAPRDDATANGHASRYSASDAIIIPHEPDEIESEAIRQSARAKVKRQQERREMLERAKQIVAKGNPK